jgi:tetratricopeptide (TPR) repeat protein
MGEWKQAERRLSQAANLEKSKAVVRSVMGNLYYAQRDYTNAIAQNLHALEFKPDYSDSHYWIGRALQAMGRYQEAIDKFELEAILDGGITNEVKASFDELRHALKKGPKGYWLKLLERTDKKPDSEFYLKAVIHVHLGEVDKALNMLQKSYETRETNSWGTFHELDFLLLDEYWDGLRDDRRFKALLKNIGYPNH